ncbi:7303_t:CDS:2, partial [Scutellospora calospora]
MLIIFTKNIESICHKCVNYDNHNQIINEYKTGNISTCHYPETKNVFDGLFNIIWDEYLIKYNLMKSPIYINRINNYGDYIDRQNKKNIIYTEKITFDNFKFLLENDQKNILNYCEGGKYEKIINDNKILKQNNLELHTLRKNICKKMRIGIRNKESFFIDFINDNKISDYLMYKGFVYNSLRDESISDEFYKDKIIELEKKCLKSLEELPNVDWFKWWRHLLNNPDNLNIIDSYWIFKKVKKLNPKTNDKNFYKLVASTFIKNLKRCNQERENICVPEILQMIDSEINCESLTTKGLYNSLLRNENFNNIVDLNINEINEIHYHIAKQKKQLEDYCLTEFIIDDFLTNDRFENFFKQGIYKPFFWDSLPLSDVNKKIIKNKWMKNTNRLINLEEKTNMNEYINRLLTISQSLKNDQLYFPDSPNIFSENLKHEKDICKNYINDDGPIKKLIELSNISKHAKEKFENRRLEILHEKANISKLYQEKLTSIKESDKYNEYINDINNSYTEDELNLLINRLSQDQILTPIQKDEIKKNIDDKIDEIKKTALQPDPNENILVDELEKDIENIDKNNFFSGLNINQCKIAIENGWNNYQIINKCVKYREFKKINVLEVKKSELDSLLDILEDILNDDKTTFKSLPENYEKDKIDNLNDNFLP